ncbi:MAG TPA: adenylyltransferase/cytidyltransferase family protein [Candidatus Saccharimonadales bacterium]|nr:adenylyltransferase/cytidyltransferase family protein [Candidatus Saccharimonadales bacterium]
MGTILSIQKINKISTELHQQNKRIVVVGGCFDILHIGHIVFLEEAKKHGDILIVFLESDQTITKSKGPKRPINSQDDRAKILSALASVDYVVMLTPDIDAHMYDELVIALKPAIIATTSGDMKRHYKERSAKLVHAEVIDVTTPVSDKSTTTLIKLLDEL